MITQDLNNKLWVNDGAGAIEVGIADLPEAVWDGVTSPGRAMQPRHASCLD